MDFVRLAKLVYALPPVDQDTIRNRGCHFDQWAGWRTSEAIPGGVRGYRFVVLARRIIGALILVEALVADMYAANRKLGLAVRRYLKRGQKHPALLHQAKRWVYDWLLRAADRASTPR